MDKQGANRKANELQSSVLTHQDDSLRQQRTAVNNGGEKSKMASNAGWNTPAASKPKNVGGVDPYKMKQSQLGSSVLEMTDYSGYSPLIKKNADINNQHFNKPVAPVKSVKSNRDRFTAEGQGTNNNPTLFDRGSAKQNNLASSHFGTP